VPGFPQEQEPTKLSVGASSSDDTDVYRLEELCCSLHRLEWATNLQLSPCRDKILMPVKIVKGKQMQSY